MLQENKNRKKKRKQESRKKKNMFPAFLLPRKVICVILKVHEKMSVIKKKIIKKQNTKIFIPMKFS